MRVTPAIVYCDSPLATSSQPGKARGGQQAGADKTKGGLARISLLPHNVAVDQACVGTQDGKNGIADFHLSAVVECEHAQAERRGTGVVDEHDGSGPGRAGDAVRQAKLEHGRPGIEERPQTAKGHGCRHDQGRGVAELDLVEHFVVLRMVDWRIKLFGGSKFGKETLGFMIFSMVKYRPRKG